MTPPNEDQQSRIFQALADTTRREILSLIARSNPSVSEIGVPFDISGPAISKHLKVLERAGLINRVKEGKQHRFQLNTQPLQEVKIVVDQLAIFWTNRLDNLDTFLTSESNSKKQKTK